MLSNSSVVVLSPSRCSKPPAAVRPPEKADPYAEKTLAAIDWEPALRNGNRWYDRMAAASRLKDRVKREQEFDGIEEELTKLKKGNADSREDLLKALRSGNDPGKAVSEQLGDHLIGMMVSPIRRIQNAFERVEQLHRNLHLAFALAAYQRDQGRYPAKLDGLAPKYLASIPEDLFSGKALIYRPEEKGYLLYSVGVNGRDEGGRSYGDEPAGDDLPVRMPPPELKRKE